MDEEYLTNSNRIPRKCKWGKSIVKWKKIPASEAKLSDSKKTSIKTLYPSDFLKQIDFRQPLEVFAGPGKFNSCNLWFLVY